MELAQQRICDHLVNSPKHPDITKSAEAVALIDQRGIIEEYLGVRGDLEGSFIGYVKPDASLSQPPPPVASELRKICLDLRGCPLS